jgi:thiol-disulfide isomerase/thioredoxin
MLNRFLATALALAASVAHAQSLKIGAPAPEIDLPSLSGGRVQLSKLHGHPIIVSFWGTWCPPCRGEFPELVRVHQLYSAAGLVVLGVNGRDQEFSTKSVKNFVKEFSVPFEIALDERGRSRQTFLILGLPTTVFIDSGGIVRTVHRGPIGRAGLDSGIATILRSP